MKNNRDPRHQALVEEQFAALLAEHTGAKVMQEALDYIDELLKRIKKLEDERPKGREWGF